MKFTACLALTSLISTTPPETVGANELCLTHVSATLKQTVRFQTLDPAARHVLVITEERETPSSEWKRTELRLTTSFAVRFVESVHANEFYLSGGDREQGSVIERWIIDPVEGARDVRQRQAPTGIGTSRSIMEYEEYVVGERWIDPDARPHLPWVQRTRLFQGKDGGLLFVDPDSRYVLLKKSRSIVRIDLAKPGPPETIFTTEEIPRIENGLAGMRLLPPTDHWFPYEGEGRGFELMIYPPKDKHWLSEEPSIFFVDLDNDGIFDSFGPTLPRVQER